MIEIFGTLGPACSETKTIEEMFINGMTGMRLNMSHTSLSQSDCIIKNFWQAAEKLGKEPELLIDLQGPEIRIGDIKGTVVIDEGDYVRIGTKEDQNADITIADPVIDKIENADTIVIDDGSLSLIAESKRGKCWKARVIRGGELKGRKSFKIVGKNVLGPILTQQDIENIKCISEYGVTALMQPFVRNGDELKTVKKELEKNKLDNIRIFAKIENKEGVSNLENIIPEADMIVIARGDLGNDMELWELPSVQKNIERICNKSRKPFMVVTQMLTSMIESPLPTRAEVSDIFNAVNDGASAVMVTNETAVGKYPVEAIKFLSKTVNSAEVWRKNNDLN